jgi:TolA-binding protein
MSIKRKKSTSKQDETLVDIVEVKESAQGFIESNQKNILGGILAFILLVGGFLAYKHLYQTPREKDASSQLSQAQLQFEKDSFAIALSNPGNGAKGFLDIAKEYSGTKAGNLANYYAGVCYLHLGQYDSAIEYLEDFSAKGDVLPATRQSLLGDAYAEKGDLEKAASYYQKAVKVASGNEFLASMYLKKVGLLAEKNQNWKAAAEAYNEIKTKYPLSIDGRDIDKYITRVNTHL